MEKKKINRDHWKNDYIDCFTSCLDLYSDESREYDKLKYMIDELKKI